MFHNDDEFHLLLSSSDSQHIYPANNASNFTVCWSDGIALTKSDNWKVALKEITLRCPCMTLTPIQGIEFIAQTGEDDVKIDYDIFEMFINEKDSLAIRKMSINKGYHHHKQLKISYNGEWLKLEAISPFIVTCIPLGWYMQHANEADANDGIYQLSTSVIAFEDYIRRLPSKKSALVFMFYPTDQTYKEDKIFFSNNLRINDIHDLRDELLKSFPDIFKTITINRELRLSFQLHKKIMKIKFLGGLNEQLGYSGETFCNHEFENANHNADSAAVLANNLTREMYIYSSCCAPMHVGDKLLPLLSYVLLLNPPEQSITDALFHLSIKKPMYIKVDVSYLNKLHVFIADKERKPIILPKGSFATIRLHFKTYKQNKHIKS